MLLFLEAIFSYDMENTIKCIPCVCVISLLVFPNSLFIKVLFDYVQEKEEVYVNVVLSICVLNLLSLILCLDWYLLLLYQIWQKSLPQLHIWQYISPDNL